MSLVLSRKNNQSVTMYTGADEKIEIKLVKSFVRSDQVAFVIDAPLSVRIIRNELIANKDDGGL